MRKWGQASGVTASRQVETEFGPSAALSVTDLNVEFKTPQGWVRAVRDVCFTVDKGSTYAIVGESGSGKSVTVRSIMRLLPPETSRITGEVRAAERDVLRLDPREMRAVRGGEIGMVFQDPMSSLNPVRTIGAQLAEPLRTHYSLSRRASRERVLDVLGLVAIPSPRRVIDSYPHEFSGGMRQRVAIARALICEPSVLLADEPTTALDVSVQAQVLEVMRSAVAEVGAALLIISHDLSVVAGIADQVGVMYAGRLVESGPVRSIFEQPRHAYTLGLMGCVTDPARASATKSMPSIPGAPPPLSRSAAGCDFADRCRFSIERCRTTKPPSVVDDHGHAASCWVDLPPLSEVRNDAAKPHPR